MVRRVVLGWARPLVALLSMLLSMLTVASPGLGAQARPVVPSDAKVYCDLERLAALGLIDTLLVGARPYTEREVVRLLGEARANIDRNPAAREWATDVIQAGLARYGRAGNRPIDEVRLDLTRLSSPARVTPEDETGIVDADINPLVAYSGGRQYVDGTTVGFETVHTATIGRFAALSIQPRLSLSATAGGGTRSTLTLQSGAVTAMFRDFSIEVGRDQVTFGQAQTSGILLSQNAPALDMVRIWNDRPWRVPLFSRVFRDLRGTLLIADLGGSRQIHPHSKLIGYHLATLPHPRFELGVQVVDVMGGNGGQPATLGDRILDAIPIIDAFRTSSDFQFSNKLAGIDLRWRMPEWRGFELYVEGAADDFDGRDFWRGFAEEAGYLGGVSFSCLVACGRWTARAEYHQTGIRYYTHTNYPLASRGFILGDPLGPRGNSGHLIADGDLGARGRIAVEGVFEVRSGNSYRATTTGPNDEGFHFELVTRRPAEKRTRLIASWLGDETSRLTPRITAGIERVHNFGFVGGADRTNALIQVGLTARR